MTPPLLTTREAADLAGVGPSAVKRWADQGRLPCVRTAGGHRRFDRAVVERFLRGEREATSNEIDAWVDLLLAPGDGHDVEARLLDERGELGSWYAVADRLGPVLGALGERWARGTITVLDEHLASERLARGLAQVTLRLPVGRAAPTALLIAADGDEHTLGLSLVEVCLRELGWRTRWAGRATPDADVVADVAAGRYQMVAVSASLSSSDRRRLARQLGRIGAACDAAGVALVIGGRGAWPPEPRHALRFDDLSTFHRFVASPRRRAR